MYWYYLSPYASSYSSDRVFLGSTYAPALITKPYTIEGITYGTRDNPSDYAELYVYREINSRYTFYYKPYEEYPIISVDGSKCRSLLLGGEVGTIGLGGSFSDGIDQYQNKKISGKWRVHDQLISTSNYYNNKNYLITVLGELTLNNGYSENFNLIGADVDGVGRGYTFITFGSISMGDSETYNNTYDVPETYKDMLIDFGDAPQDVPSFLYDFITFNFDKVYENQYTIYNENSEQVAQSEPEQPPIVKTNLINAVNSYQLALTRADDRVITLKWTNPAPDGKVFKGLSIDPNSTEIVVPVGERVVNIDKSTSFYMVYSDYTPPPVPPDPPPLPERPLGRTFDIYLYRNRAEVNRVGKSPDWLDEVGVMHGALRDECSIVAPVITFASSVVPNFNYVHIPIFGRYYFVLGIESISTGMWRMRLNCDVLETYKNQIWNLDAIIERQENDFNPLLFDNQLPTQTNTQTRVLEFLAQTETTAGKFDVQEESDEETDGHYVLITIGKGRWIDGSNETQ